LAKKSAKIPKISNFS